MNRLVHSGRCTSASRRTHRAADSRSARPAAPTRASLVRRRARVALHDVPRARTRVAARPEPPAAPRRSGHRPPSAASASIQGARQVQPSGSARAPAIAARRPDRFGIVATSPPMRGPRERSVVGEAPVKMIRLSGARSVEATDHRSDTVRFMPDRRNEAVPARIDTPIESRPSTPSMLEAVRNERLRIVGRERRTALQCRACGRPRVRHEHCASHRFVPRTQGGGTSGATAMQAGRARPGRSRRACRRDPDGRTRPRANAARCRAACDRSGRQRPVVARIGRTSR